MVSIALFCRDSSNAVTEQGPSCIRCNPGQHVSLSEMMDAEPGVAGEAEILEHHHHHLGRDTIARVVYNADSDVQSWSLSRLLMPRTNCSLVGCRIQQTEAAGRADGHVNQPELEGAEERERSASHAISHVRESLFDVRPSIVLFDCEGLDAALQEDLARCY